MRVWIFFLTCMVSLAQSTNERFNTVGWEKQWLTDEFWAEGACAGDINRDGNFDVVCGPFWYQGPGFKQRHEIYPATNQFTMKTVDGKDRVIRGFRGFLSKVNGYSDNFLSFTSDINSDGWVDYIVVGHPGTETYWFENPGEATGRHWKRHLAIPKTDNESPAFVDVTGDGRAELICMSGGALGYAEPNRHRPTSLWNWHPVARNERWQWNTHGLGFGDVNGDGLVDLITAHNWWEQPSGNAANGQWRKGDAIFNNGGSQMFAYDVDGDGLNDVITAYEAHGYGIYWYKQMRSDSSEVSWERNIIAGATPDEGQTRVVFSQPHAMALADINRDGLNDIVTGKRFWAHGPGGDVEPNAPAVLYWFELTRQNGRVTYVAHRIDDDSGIGTQVVATDVNKDGKLDVIAGNKKGLFLHFQR